MDSVRVDRLEAEGLAEVRWLPFELHPDVPPGGMSRQEYFPAAYRKRLELSPWAAAAAEVGIRMEPQDRVINSRLALGAAEFARDHGLYRAMHDALFRAFWERTGRLDEIEDLKRVGAEVGLDPAELGGALERGAYEDLIDANRREANAVGITAIPAHVFGLRFLVVGAHPYEVFKQVCERLVEDPPAPN